jgi:hypothetical protein
MGRVWFERRRALHSPRHRSARIVQLGSNPSPPDEVVAHDGFDHDRDIVIRAMPGGLEELTFPAREEGDVTLEDRAQAPSRDPKW